jgi:hypothetical protein
MSMQHNNILVYLIAQEEISKPRLNPHQTHVQYINDPRRFHLGSSDSPEPPTVVCEHIDFGLNGINVRWGLGYSPFSFLFILVT